MYSDGGTPNGSLRLPFGPAGRIFGGGFVRRQLAGIFSFRRRFLEETFGILTVPRDDSTEGVR